MTIISILRNGRYVIPESTRLSAVVLQLAIIFSVVPLCSSVELLCQTFLDVPLSRCIFARKGRQEGENGRHVLWLSSFPFPWSLALRQKSLEFRARLCSRQKYGEMKRLKRREVINVVSYCVVGCCSLVLFSVIGIARVVCKWLVKQLYFCVVLLVNVLL